MNRLLQQTDPDWPKLFTPSSPVTDPEAQVRPWLHSMRKIMDSPQNRAIGIAAPQIGIFLRFFITHLDGERSVYVNPTWTKTDDVMTPIRSIEGCISRPGFRTQVLRYHRIVARWKTLNMRDAGAELAGLEAICFQHEADHLDGRCIFPMDPLLPRNPLPCPTA